ncbi:hypothetical protein [Calothrix sp. PCC 6303]|uniref:hypothetical protein n=1 Tax=Calothrix sp. PCC 6303 TaxID=1170562 RepID=UPI0002A05542|nr:hypothetical protein [Calothrix sp. PCC 6303]AFZ03580.1 hypothetical protein Cal6303_4680 [Calothrix sp. PCC 6303]
MYLTVVQRLQTLPSVLALAYASLMGSMSSVVAQQAIPTCKAPNPGEYLLLVNSPRAENQGQLRRVLPSETKTTTCRYLNDTVTRIGGFSRIEDANRWAKFIRESAGLSATITTRPAEAVAQPVSYRPQPLGFGYAILVDYFNKTELAAQVQQVVGGDVGFVSYGQRPYLLAVYTTNQTEAYSTLQKLSERGFFAQLVDARKVMLLRQSVKLQ